MSEELIIKIELSIVGDNCHSCGEKPTYHSLKTERQIPFVRQMRFDPDLTKRIKDAIAKETRKQSRVFIRQLADRPDGFSFLKPRARR